MERAWGQFGCSWQTTEQACLSPWVCILEPNWVPNWKQQNRNQPQSPHTGDIWRPGAVTHLLMKSHYSSSSPGRAVVGSREHEWKSTVQLGIGLCPHPDSALPKLKILLFIFLWEFLFYLFWIRRIKLSKSERSVPNTEDALTLTSSLLHHRGIRSIQEQIPAAPTQCSAGTAATSSWGSNPRTQRGLCHPWGCPRTAVRSEELVWKMLNGDTGIGRLWPHGQGSTGRRRKALACGAQVHAGHSLLPNPVGSKQPGHSCSV